MIRTLFIFGLFAFLSGCGPAVFREEVFHIENGVIYKDDKSSVWLYLSPTVKSKDIFPVYFSSTKSAPYSVYFMATSNIEGYNSVFLSSVIVREAGQSAEVVLDEKVVKMFKPLPEHSYSDVRIQLPLGEMLTFSEGKEVEVCIKYGFNESNVELEHCSTFYGKKSREIKSNFNVYMSV
ncbi:hypothetical protein ACRSLK_07755 [Halopseudomonas pachastrellae]|uniref:hypothetical protein n=1 Tax=Halopseudomonas pachastrellae TaxID=254161 RepID=UPI003D7E39C4